ncbi:MAG: hypothetical protein U5K79_25265 [Cyclobacteriaceae bacterium]|nr:hypothetical protein [Cyclobacteriaceae bacterium]
MLKYAKVILTKVSFDARLFEKELRKAIKTLMKHERTELEVWCYETFGNRYKPVISRCFSQSVLS